MSKNRKVVFIGIDGAERALLLKWANQGLLPTFRSLLSKGLHGPTESIPGLFVASTWPSFYTGANPAKHSFHGTTQLMPGTYNFQRFLASESVKGEPFWNHLSREGRKVAIMDIPHCALSSSLNGIQINEFGAHDRTVGFQTWPPSLAPEIENRFGPPTNHLFHGNCNSDRDEQQIKAFRDHLLEEISRKTELTKYFLHQNNWDFFAQVYTQGHCAGHQFWHLHDSRHPWHDPKMAQSLGDPVKDIYVGIDNAIGQVIKEIDDKTTVIVLASHGMGLCVVPWGFLGKILLRLGVASPPELNSWNAKELFSRNQWKPLFSWGWQHMPSAIRTMLKARRQTLSRVLPLPQPIGIDPSSGKCFPVYDTQAHGGIRVNLVGREPHGLVKAGAKYEEFLSQLTQDLLAITNRATGNQIVKRIVRPTECFEGEYLNALPDLLVEWNTEEPIPSIWSEKIGEMSNKFWHPRTGHHKSGGLFMAFGPSIQPGSLDDPVSIMDLAPTIANLLEVNLPQTDGHPIMELVEGHRSITPTR